MTCASLARDMLFNYFGFLFLLTGAQVWAFNEADYDYSREVSKDIKIHWKEVSGDYIYLALETAQTTGLFFFFVFFLEYHYNTLGNIAIPSLYYWHRRTRALTLAHSHTRNLAPQTTRRTTKHHIDGLDSV